MDQFKYYPTCDNLNCYQVHHIKILPEFTLLFYVFTHQTALLYVNLQTYHQWPIRSKLCSPYITCSTTRSLIRKPQKATSIRPVAKNAWKATPIIVLLEGPTISIAEKWKGKRQILWLH